MTRLTPLGRRPEVEALEDRLVPAANAAANLNFMTRVELDLLHHPLDGLGVALARRLDHGASRAAVIHAFEGTGAFQAALVDDAFVQILGHGPDAGEMTGGLRFLRHGGRILDLEVRLAGTDEFFLENGATVDGFLAGLYRVGAGRLPSPAEQVSGDAALTRGENRLTVARGVLEGPAGLAFQADTVFVTLLRHHAEGGELGQGIFLVSRRGLEGLIASVLRSGEYYHLSNVHATHLIFLGQPGTQTAGVAFAAAAAAVDDAGQLDVTFTGPVTVGLGANPAGGSLQGTPTETATAGVVVFGPLSISKAGGGYTLAVSTPGLRGAATGPFTVSPASADHLVFTEQPQNTTAGQAFTVQVTAEDSFGNVDTNDNKAVSLAIGTNPGKDTLHGGPTTVTADHGVATFTNLSIDKSGSGYTLVASSTGVSAATSAAFNVSAAAATQLVFDPTLPVVNGQPTNQVKAVQAFDTTVKAEDQFGNVANYGGTVSVAIGANPSGGTLSGTTRATANNGVATFSGLSIDKEGNGYTLTASSGTLTSATSDSFNVIPGNAATLTFSMQPSPNPVGATAPFTVTVGAVDGGGNPTSYNGTVTVSIDPRHTGGGGSLGGTTSFTFTGETSHQFTLSISKGGSGYELDATGTSVQGSQPSDAITVTGPSVSFTFTNSPPPAGQVTFTATVSPPSGSTVPLSGTVSFIDSNGNVLATTGAVGASGGMVSAKAVLKAQSYTVTAQYNDPNYGTASSSSRTLHFNEVDVDVDGDNDAGGTVDDVRDNFS